MKAIAAFVLALAMATAAHAADALKVTVSHLVGWDGVFPAIMKEKGFAKEQNLDVTFINAGGGSETIQTAATGSVQIAIPAAVHGTIAAYAKGAKVRIIASALTGSGDTFWYVKADSPIQRPEDWTGKALGYSRPNSVSHMLLQNFAKERGFNAKLVSVGDYPAARTMLMTGQLDIAWAVSPFAMDIVRSGQVRIVATGEDVKAARDVIGRVGIANADYLKSNRDVVRRFMIAWHKATEYVYGPNFDEVVVWFGKQNGIDADTARMASKFFGTKENRAVTPIKAMDVAHKQALEFGFIKEPLTEAQLKELVDIVYDPAKGS